jgi:hypothetical protein
MRHAAHRSPSWGLYAFLTLLLEVLTRSGI